MNKTMRVIAMSDLHFKKGYDDKLESLVNTIGKADLLLFAGDITHFGSNAELDTVLKIVSKITDKIYAVPGNCDTKEVAQSLVERGISLEGTATIADLCLISGLGGVPQWRNIDYGFTEEELLQTLNRANDSAKKLVDENPGSYAHLLLTHVPPFGSKADRAMFMKHVGSKSVAQFLNTSLHDVCVCGHIHECVGISMINKTQLVNCGPARRGYYVEILVSQYTNENQNGECNPVNVEIYSKRDSSRYWI